jgi:capsular exopolysaccharide synthesis family protein
MATVAYDTLDDQGPAADDTFAYDGGHRSISVGPLVRHVLSITRRNLWFIAAIIGTFLVAAVIISILTTPKYTAHSSIEISDQSDQILGQQLGEDQQTQVNSFDVDRFLTSQITILKSRALADRVATKLNLYADPRFFNAMQIDQDSFKNQAELHDGVAELLNDNLDVSLPVDSRIVDIRFTSTDPQISANVANAFASEFIQSNLQRKFDSSSYARDFVQQQLNESRTRLEQSEENLNAYARSVGLIRARDPDLSTSTSSSSGNSSSSTSSVTTSSLLQVNEAANDAEAKLVAAQARWNAERAQPLLSSPAALASPTVQQLLQHRSDLQAQLDTARDRYLDNHPTVLSLESQLKNTSEQLKQAATEARDAVRTDLVAAQATVNELKAQVSALESATLEEQDRSVRYNTLAREADTNRAIYDGLLQRYQQLNASAGITASNVSVIDQAGVPTEPSSPHPFINVAIALLLGVVVAAVVVYLKDQLDDRIRVPEEVEQKVGLNLLGVVPDAKDENPVEALDDPKSIVSESYSALRTSLLYSTRDGLPPLMLVTSAQASEGKSTTSYAIARSMAQVGKRALLIDGDLRRPSIHRLAGVENEVGLSSVLVGEISVHGAIASTHVPNLFVLPSGPLPPSPAELLSSPRLVELLDAVRGQFDVAIVDSAPVLGLADSPGLSALADGVLLVVEANRGRGGQLKAAVRRLRMMKPIILGVVLTKFDPEAAGNAYSTYYQYNYYEYRSSEKHAAP